MLSTFLEIRVFSVANGFVYLRKFVFPFLLSLDPGRKFCSRLTLKVAPVPLYCQSRPALIRCVVSDKRKDSFAAVVIFRGTVVLLFGDLTQRSLILCKADFQT